MSEATHLKDDYGEAYRKKGVAQFYLKRFLDAEKSLKKSFKLNPSQPDITTDLGSIYLKNGNIKNAFRYLKIAQTRNNNAHIVFNNLGAAHAKTGKNKAKEKDFPKAIEEWETTIKLDSKDENILNSLAWAYEKLGKKKEAPRQARSIDQVKPL